MLDGLHKTGTLLAGRKVLVVDDDIRNIFAMTSVLEPHQIEIHSAETGRAAIEVLQSNPEIDVVLMDVMMPDMDGHDTMRAIRKLGKFRNLPIIALTAKAMKGDREKCIEAGASDYIAKPVDTEQLLSMLRVWLYR
jgi:CheY-like chemotaxis protein